MRRSWSVPASIVTLLVLLASVSGWGDCFEVTSGNECSCIVGSNIFSYTDQCPIGTTVSSCSQIPSVSQSWSCSAGWGGRWCTGYVDEPTGVAWSGASRDCSTIQVPGWSVTCVNSSYKYTYRVRKFQCTNGQNEADSLNCVQNGNQWDSGTHTCRTSPCTPSDTSWLNDSKAACDAIGGENNYAITDIDETCVHSGICCPSDSALVGNTCKWRCDSIYTACTAKNGYLYAGVLQDTTISGEDSIFTNKCYYNCSYAYNKDSTTSVTDGNIACSSPSTPIAECTRMPNDFASVRTIYGDSVYSYDFLTPGSAAYIDSIVLTPCSRFMYRCTVNGKYKYWYSDADIPTGCTNIVKIK